MSLPPRAEPQAATVKSIEDVYRQWFRPVVRWLPAMGVPRGDVEDVAQEVFMVAQRRLDAFDGTNPGGWLYAISLRVASNHRRLAWVRRLLLRDEDEPDVAPVESETPESRMAQRQLAELADELLAGMSDKLRRAFVLFEVAGYGGEEIAALEGIPIATVWTRLHNARKEFAERATILRRKRGIS